MKKVIFIICLMFNNVFAMQSVKPYQGESDEKVSSIRKNKLESLLFKKVNGREPLVKNDDKQIGVYQEYEWGTIENLLEDESIMGIVVTKLNIVKDLFLMIFAELVDIYHAHHELIGKVPSLDIVQTDGDEVRIEFRENLRTFPNLESLLKTGKELLSQEKFREKVITHSIALFMIQLFFNIDLAWLMVTTADAENKWIEEHPLSNGGAAKMTRSPISFYKCQYQQRAIGIARIANLAIRNVGFREISDTALMISVNTLNVLSDLQSIFLTDVLSTEIELRPNFSEILGKIESMTSDRLIIRKDLKFLLNNVFHISEEMTNRDILMKLMFEVCIKANHVKDDEDEYSIYIMSSLRQ